MDFGQLIRDMTRAACAGDGERVAACFTPNGVYHDVFYGAFAGRDRIAVMINEYFHRDAKNFRWDIHEPVSVGDVGYARYVFSFTSKLAGHEGRRTLFEGVAMVTLDDGLIAEYREIANTLPGLQRLGFTPDRLLRICDRQGQALADRDDARAHL